MKILITGPCGLIADNLINSLSSSIKIYSISNKKIKKNKKIIKNYIYKNNYTQLSKFINSIKPDIVLHLATKWKKIDDSDQKDLIDTNIIFSSYLIQICSNIKLKIFVNTSSYSQINEKGIYKPFNLYSASKYSFEKILYYYYLNFNFKIINLRIMNVYGSLEDNRIVNYILRNINNKNKILKVNDIHAYIDLVHIKDVVDAFKSIIFSSDISKYKYFTYDIRSNKQIMLKQLIKSIEKVCKTKFTEIVIKKTFKQYLFKPYRKRRLIEWSPKVSLLEGLKKLNYFFLL